ncbi:MAG: DUF4926 domain-containing protein [Chloroflexota bacterium]
MLEEFAIVALTLDLPDYGLKAGDTGTVVDVVQSGKAYIVEFMTILGKTLVVAEVSPDQIRRVEQDEITNARQVVTSH